MTRKNVINRVEPLETLPEGEEFRTYLTDSLRQIRDSVTPVVEFEEYTVANLPSASDNPPPGLVMCTDEVGGYVPVFWDGTNWRRVTDRAIAST